MKNLCQSCFLMVFLGLFCCFSLTSYSQATNPQAQALPYIQNFDGLIASSTTYPAGFQGWKVSGSPAGTFNTNAVLDSDRLLKANSTAATTSGDIHNYDGKIGFLNTGSLDLAIGFALNTIGKKGIAVQYDAMMIRNPYDGSANTRVNEMVLQYRVGTSSAFTSLLSSSYLSNTTRQVTGTTALNPQTIGVTLPEECENQSYVQIRWISRQNSGSGFRPSFAIDNISIQNDVIAPVNITGYPKIDNILQYSFDFSTQLDEIGKVYFVVLPGGSAKPSITQIKAGLDANENRALQSNVLDIANKSLVYVTTISGLSLNTSYSVFSIAEDHYGNIQDDSNQLDVLTPREAVPSITTTISSLNFEFQERNFDSKTFSYQLRAENLSSFVTLTATGNFSISKESATNFQSTLAFDSSDFDSNKTPTVYVRFSPNDVAPFSGQIIHQSAGAMDKMVTLEGIGINPYHQDFNDTNVLSNSGWTAYSVTGDRIKWESTSTRFNSSPAAMQINGYSENGASNDWLISPNLRLDSFDKFPLLSFYSRKFFEGPNLKLMISVDYDGVSNPEAATWTQIEGDFPATTGVFKQSNFINLEAYKTNHTFLAWVYETTAAGANNNAEWTIDDISITNESAFVASNPNLNFGEVAPNTISDSRSFIFSAGGYGAITLTAPTDYSISIDNQIFQSSLTISEMDAFFGRTIYVRFTPSTKALNISGSITITATGLNQQMGFLTGSSLPKTQTFDIVSYNLEFFGSDVKNTSGIEFGPTDDALQIDNVAKVMNKLNADVYVVQEVSDDPSLDILIQKLSINGKTFDKSISPVWSYSFDEPDPNFPPQKLVVLYNTKTTKVKNTRVLFRELFNSILDGNTTLPNYPAGNSQSFFASGRLPYMVEIETNIAGAKRDIQIIDIHARANSGTDISKYNMRKYDVEFLKDSLDVHYPNDDFIILGDFNDDVKESVIAGNPSSYQKFVEDTLRYNPLTLGISNAGAYSFLSSGGFLDHIICSNELTNNYVSNSIAVYDPRVDIPNYVNTTSDHGPVIARFEFLKTNQSPIVKQELPAQSIILPNTMEINLLDIFSDPDSDPLIYSVEAADVTIAETSISENTLRVLSKKEGSTSITITADDGAGDIVTTSFNVVISPNLSTNEFNLHSGLTVKIYPNPAKDLIYLSINSKNKQKLVLKFYDSTGRIIGTPIKVQEILDERSTKIEIDYLQSGIYYYTLSEDDKVVYKSKFIKI